MNRREAAGQSSGSSNSVSDGAGSSLQGQTSSATGMTAHQGQEEISLPQTRVRSIMKFSPEVEIVGSDALYVITKATEMFVQHMASEAAKAVSLEANPRKNVIDYKDLADLVDRDENLEFLKDIVPQKMTAREALEKIRIAEKRDKATKKK